MTKPSNYRNRYKLKCERCKGSGFEGSHYCPVCEGEGKVSPTVWAREFVRKGEAGEQ